jgi:hypothetical protein
VISSRQRLPEFGDLGLDQSELCLPSSGQANDFSHTVDHELDRTPLLVDLGIMARLDYDGYPVVLVNLDKVDHDELRELITDSWMIKAPPKLRRQFESQ